MRKILLIFLLIPLLHHSQQYGNEWINYSQQYFKFPIYKTGIHRLEYNTIKITLFQSGVDISTITTNEFQVFGKEKEVAIHIEDEDGNGFLNGDDYIEFYAEKNTSWLDSLVYTSPEYVTDPYYSLFNDTIRYYLTWTSQGGAQRMIKEDSINFNSFSPRNYCWNKNYVKFFSNYTFGEQEEGLSSPLFEKGEGWVGPVLTKGNSNSEIISSENVYSSGPSSKARVTIISSNSAEVLPPVTPPPPNHNTKLYFNNSPIMDTSYYGYDKINFSFPVNVNSSTSSITHEIGAIGQGTDRQHISEITLWYPHNFNFNGDSTFTFGLANNPNSLKSRVDFTNLNSSVNNPILYVINNEIKRIKVVYNGSNGSVLIPNSTIGDSSICYITDSLNFFTINDFSPVGTNGFFRDFESLNLNDAYIIVTHKKLMTEAINYGAYRSTDYDTVVVDIEELYHQYGAGIYLHPLSIKRFLKMTMNEWNSWPSHLFLIGKSITIAPQPFTNLHPRNSNTLYNQCLVPSYGYPSSDNHFAVGLDLNSKGFSIPIGRLSCSSASELNSYLNKTISYELQQNPFDIYNLANKEWQKNILHFGGGADTSEQNYITTWLSYFENTIEDTLFGGYVHNFSKDPFSNSLNNNDFQEVAELLEDGVSIITFFGHSGSAIGFSQNIDSPDNWNNEDKYPLVIGIGCYSGDVHNPDTTNFSQSLVSPDNEGAIAFLSTIKQGITPFTNQYVNFLYDFIASKGYGKTIGQQMKMTVDSIDQFTFGIDWNPIYQSTYNGFSLQGDPAIKTNHHNKPEIVLDSSRIWQSPSAINLSIDTFELNLVITNIGRAYKDSVRLELIRYYPDGSSEIISRNISGTNYLDTVVLSIPVNPLISVGFNQFEISIDLPLSAVEEQYDEFGNNTLTKNIIILSNAIQPVWPYDFAIVGTQIDTLKGSTMNPFEPAKNYIFEIDTTDEFNSPFKKYQQVNSPGGVVEALPNNWLNSNINSSDPLYFTDSTVYFWRCSPDSSVLDWKEHSFQYIPNKWGWGQSHFFQFKNNSLINIEYNRPARTFDFSPSISKIKVETNINFSTGPQWEGTSWSLSGERMDYGGWLWPSIIVGVVDNNTLKPWCVDHPSGVNCEDCHSFHCAGQFNGPGPSPCGINSMGRNRCQKYFIFHFNNAQQLDNLATFLNNIPDSSYVVAYSYIPDNFNSPLQLYNQWPSNLYTAFSNLGATGFQPGMDDVGFALFSQKGNPSSIIELYSNPVAAGVANPADPVELLSFEANIYGNDVSGYISSSTAGPALNWEKIYWEQHALETITEDSSRLKVYGLSFNNTKTLLLDELFTTLDQVDISTIDPLIYPKIQLEAYTIDSANSTPVQIDRWQILYDPAPELAVNPKKGYFINLNNNGIQEGDSIRFAVVIENISKFDMDSLLVKYDIYDETFTANTISYPRQDSLKAGDILMDTIVFSTTNLPGDNNLWITANPMNFTTGKQDQPEQFYFNNILQTNFNVLEDVTNPLLDVTFDGIHILNNDIISPTPSIVISLDDENEFLLLNEQTDTSNFSVFILYPSSNNWERIHFKNSNGEDIMNFFPANNSKNTCRIEYNPTFTLDGNYSIKVQARDKKNNYSGDNEYQINFEVITASKITNIYNYPNPFSTKTHFVFTLTGSVFPDDILIQIFSVSGKVVKEITMADLGNIKIGHNKTDYFWDGRDQFGDLLANGIYFYKVTAKINGENIEHRNTSGDHAFKKGFGKMYLMR
ncbi:MAG: hypothetical protein CL853_01770 [Crocinitomicaceae bacterium]|nr:hypothetical protein [Crocinitomicaceae bacterium]